MPDTTSTSTLPAIFEGRPIRQVFHAGEWHGSIIDAIAVLTGSKQPGRYWPELKKKLADEGAAQLLGKIEKLKMASSDGKLYKTDAANEETMLRIVQSVPSPRAEPFRRWLAQVGAERLREERNPDLIAERAVRTYRKRGYTDDHILARIEAKIGRRTLTDEYDDRGARSERYDYRNLTNAFYVAMCGMTAQALCKALGVPKDPRDHVHKLVLVAIKAGEAVAVETAAAMDAQGYHDLKVAAQAGGDVARAMIQAAEARLGMPLLPRPANANKRRLAA